MLLPGQLLPVPPLLHFVDKTHLLESPWSLVLAGSLHQHQCVGVHQRNGGGGVETAENGKNAQRRGTGPSVTRGHELQETPEGLGLTPNLHLLGPGSFDYNSPLPGTLGRPGERAWVSPKVP